MKKINKLLMTLFCMSMAFCVASCGGGGKDSSSATDSSADVTSEIESATSESESEESSELISESASLQESEESESSEVESESSEDVVSSEESSEIESESSEESDSSELPDETTFTVTFKQNGCEDKTFTVKEGEAFTEIPTPAEKTGYTVTWEEKDYSAITEDMTVNAIETANTYEITFDAKDGNDEQVVSIEYNAEYTLPEEPSIDGYTFTGWYYNGEKVESTVWNIAENATLVAGWTENAVEEGEYAAKFMVDYINYGENVTASFVTKDKYAAGSTVSFKYYIPADVTSSWFAVCGAEDPNNTSIYANWLWQGVPTKGNWDTMTVTLTADSYIHFAGAALEWGYKDEPATVGYILIDDFTVTTGDTTVTENFNTGVTSGLFNVNDPMAVGLGEGVPAFEEGEYAVKLDFSNCFDLNANTFITQEAVAKGGSRVSFAYYIPEETTTGDWWALCWDTNGSSPNYWAPGNGTDNAGGTATSGGLFVSQEKGIWLTASVILPASDSDYYLYFAGYSKHENTAWSGNVYIDDLKIGDVKEDFNKPLNESIFSCGMGVSLSDKGEGYVAPPFEEGNYAMKLILTAHDGKVPFVTKKSYSAGSTISFKYYIPEGTTTNWWRFSYGQNKSSLDYYNSAFTELAAVVGKWTEVSITLPGPGAPYYFFFANEEGHWTLNGGTAYLLIDDIAVDGEIVEDFNKPLEDCIFEVIDAKAIDLSAKDEGYDANATPEAPTEVEFAEKIIVDKLDSS